jgi:hypothetical protein
MPAKKDKPNERGSKLEQHVAERLAALRAKLDDQVEIAPQHPVILASGRKAIIDFRLLIRFSHETQNYYIEVQSRKKHDHELMDKIEAVRRDTQLKTFRFIHDTPLEEAVAKEFQSRGVICYDLIGFDTFLKGIEVNLTAVNRLQQQVERGDRSVDAELKSLVEEIASADKDIAHALPAHNPRREQLVNEAIDLAKNNPDAVRRIVGDFLRRL